MKLTNVIQQIREQFKPVDQFLHYIGHGQLESSAQSNSTLHVLSHELDHVAEFKSKAKRDGKEIANIDLKVNYEFRNGRLVAVSGKTTATTRPGKNNSVSETQNIKAPRPTRNPEIAPLRRREEILDSYEIESNEKRLKEKLNEVVAQINGSPMEYYIDPRYKTLENIKEENKRIELAETKSRIEVRLMQLKSDEFIHKSRSLMKKLVDLQDSLKSGFAKLGIMAKQLGDKLDIFG